jgi:signal transduction histidine kinase
MKQLFDLSFRIKLPLWSSFLIVATALAVSGALMLRAYDDLKEDLLISSKSLGRTLSKSLFRAMLHDDVWRAFELVQAPFHGEAGDNPVQPDAIIVLDRGYRIVVSSRPTVMPMLADFRRFGPEQARLADAIEALQGRDAHTVELPGAGHLYVVVPIADEAALLGALVISHSKSAFVPRFWRTAQSGALIGLLVLAVLLPANWYWGRRMAAPLVKLADHLDGLGQGLPEDLDPGLYAYRDELGRLFQSYRRMVQELREKAQLERRVVQTERLAAVGRLAAGIAHEINNPLGGMLTAVDTLKCHADADPLTLKTIDLIERGLVQVKETVGALLVEARLKSRDLAKQDIEDVRTLVAPASHRKRLKTAWCNDLPDSLPLPATLVRQIFINLLLNAIQAAGEDGEIGCLVECVANELTITVTNDGRLLTPEQMEHLFEPFSPLSESGHGLGLWVTYQIVHQLGGRISAKVEENLMVFEVRLPVGAEA